MKKSLFILFLALVLTFALISNTYSAPSRSTWWKFQSIDTMKYSRDLAREKLHDPDFNIIIERQVKQIAQSGASHIAIATPYDDEFLPFLRRWVRVARDNNLKIWFRGNFSGWEEWFEYKKIDREEHIDKTRDFISQNKGLFEDGDVFSACPECENGGPGDPRTTHDIDGHRKFLIEEYKATKKAFLSIDKLVMSNFASMNADVARLIMDSQTTFAMDNVVTIDHYVGTPEKLVADVKAIAQASGGKIVLGEFGAPIPDINGEMSDEEQAEWIKESLSRLAEVPEIFGVNYWTNVGSSTSLWDEDGNARAAVDAVSSVYNAPVISGRVLDEAGGGIDVAYITIGTRRFFTDSKGNYKFPFFNIEKVEVAANDYVGKSHEVNADGDNTIVLKRVHEGLGFKIRKFINNIKKSLPNFF